MNGATSYVYGPEGERVATVQSGAVSAEYLYGVDGTLTTELAPGGKLMRGLLYAGGMHLADYTQDGKTVFHLSDEVGSLVNTIDQTGAAIETCAASPFGESLNCSPSVDYTENHFTDKKRDQESGLDYFGARYYSSTESRFTTPDWAVKATPVPYAKLDNPQSLNLYAYVENNPLSRMDPDGHIDCSGNNASGVGCQAISKYNSDHGISPTASRSNFPGVPVTLPNGSHVADPHSSTGMLMALTSSVSDVAAAGKKAGQDAQRLDSQSIGGIVFNVELGRAVGTGGQFDDQRMGPQSDVLTGGFQQLPQFRDVSNFNVGLFAQQAGMTLDQTLQAAGDFAKHFSSNYSPGQPYGLAPQTADFIKNGFQADATQF